MQIGNGNNFSRIAEAADYIDVVTVANLHTYTGTEHPYADLDWSTIHAFENLNMDIDVVLADDEALSDEVEAAKGILA